MKVTISLTDAEIKGIAEYLRDGENVTITKKDIENYIDVIVNSAIHNKHDAVNDYISKYETI